MKQTSFRASESTAESAPASDNDNEADVEDLLLLSRISRPAAVKPRAQQAAAAPPKEKKPKAAKQEIQEPSPVRSEIRDAEEDVEEVTLSEKLVTSGGKGKALDEEIQETNELRVPHKSRAKSRSPERKSPSPLPRKEPSPAPVARKEPSPARPATVPLEQHTKLEKKLKEVEQQLNYLRLEMEQVTQVHEDDLVKLKSDFSRTLETATSPLREEIQVLHQSNLALTGALGAKVSEGKEANEVMSKMGRQVEEARGLLGQLDKRRLEAEGRVAELKGKLREADTELNASRQAGQQLQQMQGQVGFTWLVHVELLWLILLSTALAPYKPPFAKRRDLVCPRSRSQEHQRGARQLAYQHP